MNFWVNYGFEENVGSLGRGIVGVFGGGEDGFVFFFM